MEVIPANHLATAGHHFHKEPQLLRFSKMLFFPFLLIAETPNVKCHFVPLCLERGLTQIQSRWTNPLLIRGNMDFGLSGEPSLWRPIYSIKSSQAAVTAWHCASVSIISWSETGELNGTRLSMITTSTSLLLWEFFFPPDFLWLWTLMCEKAVWESRSQSDFIARCV